MDKIIENGLNKSVLNMVSYDTVIMVLYQQQSDVSFQRSVPQHLDTGSLKTLPYGSDDMKICGTVENLRITVYPEKIVIMGSLCKYLKGNNVQGLSMEETRQAIDFLSQKLCLPLRLARVMRIDVAYNAIVSQNPKEYLNRLGSLSRHDRLEEPDSLYYKQSKTLLYVYDKLKEMKRKREFFDCGFNGNILRIELRFSYGKQDWKRRFGTETVLIDMLLNETFFINLVKMLYGRYKKIEKVNDVQLDLRAVKGKKDARLFLIAYILKVQGYVPLEKMISEQQKTGRISSEQADYLRFVISEANSIDQSFIQKSGHIEELDAAFELMRKMYGF
jgi:hypothetical protein